MDGSIGLRFDIDQPSVCSLKGDDGVLSLVKAEQDKGAPQTRCLSIIVYGSGEVPALIFIKNKAAAAGGVFEDKVPELLEARVSKFNSLVV